MIKFHSLLLSAAVALCCISCGDDDSNEPAGGDGGSSNSAAALVNPDRVFTHGVPAQVDDMLIMRNSAGLVTKIVTPYEVYSFNYTSAGRASGNVPSGYDMTMTISDFEEAMVFYIKLNNQGFIRYAYEVYNDDYSEPDEWWFKYDANGRLTEMKRSEGDNEITSVIYNADGDITQVNVCNDDNPDGDLYAHVSYTDIANPTPIANKGAIMLYDEVLSIDMDEMAPAYYAGLLGKATTHLPLEITEIDNDKGYNFKTVTTCTWVLNANQMPVMLTLKSMEYTPWTGDTPYIYEGEPVEFKW